ncbi:hypothetical protein COU79_00895 [Candidatus Peregrinibacteria bacterium CG10_big_fil_rev_8_21_14_0_10_54_7]|nr:MAG: hypothetical protein COU79_00895 [Candidatus Peregrinibacteria bacterium CG10_big_fil_rev_8_21_14_0_10_54_7]
MFTSQALNEFKEIYREDYGITLTDQETLEKATSFFTLMQAICRPLPDEPHTNEKQLSGESELCLQNSDMLEYPR